MKSQNELFIIGQPALPSLIWWEKKAFLYPINIYLNTSNVDSKAGGHLKLLSFLENPQL